MKNQLQSGEVLTLTAPYTVTSGQGALVGGIFGIAAVDITSGSAGEFAVEGVFDVAKDASVFSAGDKVYWDNTAKACTSTANSNTLIGRAAQAQLTGDATVRVDLNEATLNRYFVSAQQTGTGSTQNVAHGLGVVPKAVLVIPQDTTASLAITYGTHTSTNVVVTVTTAAKFLVLAWS
jgi:predicted RecA/RadA family phage recombinase